MGTSSTGISREAFISNVAKDIAGKIPEPFDTQLLKKSMGVPSPTQVVLLQEVERWNKVSKIILSGIVWSLVEQLTDLVAAFADSYACVKANAIKAAGVMQFFSHKKHSLGC